MSDMTPIVNLGSLYIFGMNLSWVSNTAVSVAAGGVRDSTNTIDMQNSQAIALNILATGVNGLDTGTVAASTLYAVYSIADSSQNHPNAMILSLSFAQPNLPFGYDSWRRVGAVRTDGSSHILPFWQYGSGQTRSMLYDAALSAVDGGASTTYAPLDLTGLVPPTACQVIARLLYVANSATNVAEFVPYGSSSTNGIAVFGTGVAAQQAGILTVPCELNVAAPTVLYKVTSGSDDLDVLVAGYEDQL